MRVRLNFIIFFFNRLCIIISTYFNVIFFVNIFCTTREEFNEFPVLLIASLYESKQRDSGKEYGRG